jgi:MFS family permease
MATLSRTSPDTGAAPQPSANQWALVGLLFAAVLINYIDRGNLSVVAVPLMDHFQISPGRMGTLLSAFFWTYGLMQIPVGYLVDRFGLKWTYAAAFLLWSLASTAVGLASSFNQVLAFRLMLGVGEAVAQPASLAYIRQNFPKDQQGLPTAVYLSGMMIGPATGAFLGAALFEQLGWRNLFIFTGLGGCVWLLPWILLAPNRGPALVEERLESRAKIPWAKLLRNPMLWGIVIGSFFYSYFWYFCLTWIPSYLVMEHKLSFLRMGAYTAIPMAGMAIVSTLAGKAADMLIARYGSPVRIRVMFICTGFVLGSSSLSLLLVNSANAALGVLLFALVGLSLASSNFWALSQSVSPASMVGRMIGFQNMIANMAGICAPILTGYLMGAEKNFRPAIWFAGAALWVAAAAYFTLVREKSAEEFRTLGGEA